MQTKPQHSNALFGAGLLLLAAPIAIIVLYWLTWLLIGIADCNIEPMSMSGKQVVCERIGFLAPPTKIFAELNGMFMLCLMFGGFLVVLIIVPIGFFCLLRGLGNGDPKDAPRGKRVVANLAGSIFGLQVLYFVCLFWISEWEAQVRRRHLENDFNQVIELSPTVYICSKSEGFEINLAGNVSNLFYWSKNKEEILNHYIGPIQNNIVDISESETSTEILNLLVSGKCHNSEAKEIQIRPSKPAK